ncbi:hypothetical protein ALC60_00937 [Trachymyrmex zeteki]|uniref:CCHC-type domain-containing protein n=1 Tax=Mycetomoellerius zeteki TaxID=64791 RepID=A0A151XI82_9HYME|nr:hypothetical protein ALC60_00937 [Trachymyrmex zeteki]
MAPRRLGTVWAQCPVVAAKKICEAGRIKVGWVSARVALLNVRHLQCFKCLEVGHVRATYNSTIDRTGCCYQCGWQGNTTRECKASANCPACAAAGKPAVPLKGRRVKGTNSAAPRLREQRLRPPRCPFHRGRKWWARALLGRDTTPNPASGSNGHHY